MTKLTDHWAFEKAQFYYPCQVWGYKWILSPREYTFMNIMDLMNIDSLILFASVLFIMYPLRIPYVYRKYLNHS